MEIFFILFLIVGVFLGLGILISLAPTIIASMGMARIQRQIDKDPEMKAKQERITELGDKIRKDLERYKKTDPKKYKEMKDLFGV